MKPTQPKIEIVSDNVIEMPVRRGDLLAVDEQELERGREIICRQPGLFRAWTQNAKRRRGKVSA